MTQDTNMRLAFEQAIARCVWGQGKSPVQRQVQVALKRNLGTYTTATYNAGKWRLR